MVVYRVDDVIAEIDYAIHCLKPKTKESDE